MINKYDKAYQEFLDIVAEIHNAHLAYKNKPTNGTSLRVRKAISALKQHVVPFRASVMDSQKEYRAEQQRKWQEHKNNIREKKEARDKRRELRKQNGQHN